jgi:hypothetical protein
VAVLVDAERLPAVVGRQQRNPPKAGRRRPDKWNDRLSDIRSSSDFSRVVDTRSGTIFAAAKVTQMLRSRGAMAPGRGSSSSAKIACSPNKIIQVVEAPRNLAGIALRGELRYLVGDRLRQRLPGGNESYDPYQQCDDYGAMYVHLTSWHR